MVQNISTQRKPFVVRAGSKRKIWLPTDISGRTTWVLQHGSTIWAILVIPLALWIFLDVVFLHWTLTNSNPNTLGNQAISAGAYTAALYICIAGALIGGNPLNLFSGEDGTWSTSIAQAVIWSFIGTAALGAFVFVDLVHHASIANGSLSPGPNLLAAMGISATTWVGAKAITTGQVDSGVVTKTATSGGGLFTADNSAPDLSKIQVLTWTLIAVVVFVVKVIQVLSTLNANPTDTPTPVVSVPDIDPLFMVFMGLGSAAYLGKKLTTTDVPLIGSLTPRQAALDQSVTIKGGSFGEPNSGGQVLLDGTPILEPSWDNNQVQFKVPTRSPDSGPWPQRCDDNSRAVTITVVVNGRESNGQTLTVVGDQPVIAKVVDTNNSPVSTIAASRDYLVQGCGFVREGTRLLLNDSPRDFLPITNVTPERITFTFQGGPVDDPRWASGARVRLSAQVQISDNVRSWLVESDPVTLTIE